MSRTAVGWNLLILGLVIGLIVAVWPRSDPGTAPASGATPATSSAAAPSPPATDLAAPRAAAALQSCPRGQGGADGALAGLTLDCLGDGAAVDVGAALAGRPAILDLWAWNCAPCAEELPAMQAYARRAAPALTVLTVHSNPATANGLQRLAALDVHLAGVADPGSQLAARLGAPAVLPVTVFVRADGSVAKILAEPYTDADAISADVEQYLGVAP